ncbi:hypothetical protein GIB67_029654 [Kingdonia uniflora]|uniref:Uncharacterized protein n=1 Tax=Kingdonia uniflora TaxID=39325 RepID=A0A7J7LLD8_9MAGN|nr:hypothetical protein GIB67_029654 [Kingdonia uniflora]
MGATSPGPFSDISKQAKDLLSKDYNFDHKFTLTMLSDVGMGLIATCVKRDRLFVSNISTQYKSGSTIVDVKVDIHSNVSTTVVVHEIFPCTKETLSFKIPYHKSDKLDVQYLYSHAAITSCIGLTPTPFLEGLAAIRTKEFSLDSEVVFDTSTTSFTKYNAGISMVKPDLSSSLILYVLHSPIYHLCIGFPFDPCGSLKPNTMYIVPPNSNMYQKSKDPKEPEWLKCFSSLLLLM